MSGVFAPPSRDAYADERTWRDAFQVYGALTGRADWGAIVALTALADDANKAVTIKNGGAGGALQVYGSDNVSRLLVDDAGVSVSALSTAGDLTVGGNLQVGGTLHVTGATTLDGALSAGASTLASLHVTGNTTLDGTLSAGASTLASLHVTGTSALDGTATLGANLAFSATGQRITGDLSNGTFANRLAFQTSTANGTTLVEAIPNGTSNVAGFGGFSSSTPGSADVHLVVEALATEGALVCASPSGTFKPMTFYTSNAKQLTLDTSGNLTLASGGLNLGTTGASTGGIKATNLVQVTAGGILVSAGGQQIAAGGLSVTGSSVFNSGLSITGGLAVTTGAVTFPNTTLGLFGVAAVARPTVTGSRGGNAALASLLTQLASTGIIVDSSTA